MPKLPILKALLEAGLLIDTGVPGIYGRSGMFEDVITRFEAVGDRRWERPGRGHALSAGMNRAHFARSGYMKSFPQLAGVGAQLLRRQPCPWGSAPSPRRRRGLDLRLGGELKSF